MTKRIIIILITIIFFSYSDNISAQSVDKKDPVIKETNIMFPPLMELIDSAMKHNSVVRFRNLEIEAKESKLISERNYWTRNFGLQADTRYGTFDNFSTNNDGLSTKIFNTSSTQFNYGAGVYMKFPIVDMIDRKNQIKRAKVEVEQAMSMADAQQDELRQLVIRQYQDVLLKQRLLKIRSEALSNAKINMEMIEKEFRNGVIPVFEYVRISDNVARVESDFETSRTEFITAKMILEDIAGFSFSNPVLKK